MSSDSAQRDLTRSWPDPLARAALYGVAGNIVEAIKPHTEADPVAILLQFLVAFGNVIGRHAYYKVEAVNHHLNLFAVLVGQSSKARKGTSLSHVLRLFEKVDFVWRRDRVLTGLSSGEGLVWAVRDRVEKSVPTKFDGESFHKTVTEDMGVQDKRLLVVESEFANPLRMFERDGNTLSGIIRNAWDSGDFNALTKNSPAKATGAHISIIGHITTRELRRYFSETEQANGFGNRILWACAARSKFLPEGGQIESVDFTQIQDYLKSASEHFKTPQRITKNSEAQKLWNEIYHELSDSKPGLLGDMTSRSEAQVTRLACIYALLDFTCEIKKEHLQAALALWKYLEQSCQVIFGDAIGDPVADQILAGLRNRPAGMTRTEIRNLFHRNQSGEKIQRALSQLLSHSLAYSVDDPKPELGRQAQRWYAAPTTTQTTLTI